MSHSCPTRRSSDRVQFHGSETPEWLWVVKRLAPAEIWKAIGLKDAETLARMQKFHGIADRILFDAPAAALPGGTGTRFDWSLLKNHRHSKIGRASCRERVYQYV